MNNEFESSHEYRTQQTLATSKVRATRSTSALFVAVGLFAFGGCGSDSSNDAAGTAAPSEVGVSSTATTGVGDAQDPCRLITAAEAEAALGMPVQAAVINEFDTPGYGHGADCSYTSVDQSAGPTTVHVGVLGEGFPRDQWEQSERAEGFQEVPGLGDIAFFDEFNETIDAFVDGRWVQAQMINTNESELLAALTEIVRTAIERL